MSVQTLTRFMDTLKVLGIKHSPISETYDGEWRRVFILSGDITIGRASFKNNILFSLKNYKKSYHSIIDDQDRIFMTLARYNLDGYRMSRETFQSLVTKAETLVHIDHSAKVAWRQAHPKTGPRKRLTLRNPRFILHCLVTSFDPISSRSTWLTSGTHMDYLDKQEILKKLDVVIQ